MNSEQTDFHSAFRGTFSGIMRWEQLDDLWQRVRDDAAGAWYLYAVGDAPPTETVSENEVVHFIDHVDELLRKEHEEDYCGIVYVDDTSAPSFVKIFDPNNLGVSCGYSDNPPLPGWILSKLLPVDLQAPMQHRCRSRGIGVVGGGDCLPADMTCHFITPSRNSS
jgi:hypothetical protein